LQAEQCAAPDVGHGMSAQEGESPALLLPAQKRT
jgi:hypothetical protein